MPNETEDSHSALLGQPQLAATAMRTQCAKLRPFIRRGAWEAKVALRRHHAVPLPAATDRPGQNRDLINP
jgi:hypothetical protein